MTMQTASDAHHLSAIAFINRTLARHEDFMMTLDRAGVIDDAINDAAADMHVETEHRLERHYDMVEHVFLAN